MINLSQKGLDHAWTQIEELIENENLFQNKKSVRSISKDGLYEDFCASYLETPEYELTGFRNRDGCVALLSLDGPDHFFIYKNGERIEGCHAEILAISREFLAAS